MRFSDYRSRALEALSSPQLVIRRMLQWVSKRKFVDMLVKVLCERGDVCE